MTWFSKSLSRSWYSLVYINKMYTNCVCNIFYEFSVLCLREEKGKKFLRAETLQSMSLFEVISLWLNCSLAPSFPVRSDSSSFRMSSLSAILSLSSCSLFHGLLYSCKSREKASQRELQNQRQKSDEATVKTRTCSSSSSSLSLLSFN